MGNAGNCEPVSHVRRGIEGVDRFVDVAALLKAGISVVAINYRLIRHAEAENVVPLNTSPSVWKLAT